MNLVFTYGTDELFGISRVSDYEISNLSDNVVLLPGPTACCGFGPAVPRTVGG